MGTLLSKLKNSLTALDLKRFLIDINTVIHPENRFKDFWDFFILAVTVFAALEIPLSIVFNLTARAAFSLSSWFLAVVFVIDIIINFNTAFQAQGKTITDRKTVRLKYIQSWFGIDLAAALPVSLLLTMLSTPVSGVLALLRLNPLLKLPHVGKTLRKIGGANINPAILRLLLLFFWILLAAHLVACGWIFITGNPEGLDPITRYIEAFYWTITTLTTIGYGDITPAGNIQIIYVVFIELLGAGMYGLVIGNIASLIANIDVAKTQYREKLDKINAFLKYRNIPNTLQRKINNYYNYLWESRRGYDESAVLHDLPVPLKVSVSLFLNKEIIEKVPIFEKASEDLIKDIIMNLTPVVFTPGDYIVQAAEVGFDMYFISKGAVDVMSADEKTIYATLTTGQFFGEIALLLSMPRTATIKAREYCDLYRLDKETFDRVLTRYPEFAETIQELAEKRGAEIEAIKIERERAEKIELIQAVSAGSVIKLRWNEVKDLRHYEVIKRVPETGKWRYLTKKVLEPTFTDEQIFPHRPNVYRVRAVNISGPGPWSKPVIVNRPDIRQKNASLPL